MGDCTRVRDDAQKCSDARSQAEDIVQLLHKRNSEQMKKK